ncbi:MULTISPECIES: DsbA family protein [Arthrobacter]|uniref:DsbA family protein n=1 Tax=Arthrobacter caoxuetaonis TaxID=2886935 RepID=A0A9X1MHV5_9MICC|nr:MULTISPECIES: thioredoxin domain-containing protein [Arthrobacter]MCC3284170.1 DsbA family protein [Arthrobacter caoxuetaonis]MCC3299505.1 DsbA family protein [Arthrobacter caoxuetaonis]MCC9194623.1 DsbA family protein [Arthrobacter sp. zg-Y916]USQ57755.1 DsbA family protein [Arthrobacter caoxuetaonis]
MSDRNPKATKADRQAAAREKARALREAQLKKERRNKLLTRWGIVAGIVAVIAIVAVIVVNSLRGDIPDAGPAPANGNADGGFTLTSTTALEPTEPLEVDVNALPEATTTNEAGDTVPAGVEAAGPGEPVQIVEYVDINCVHCADFTGTYGDQIGSWLDAGEVTYEYRTVAFLDRNSPTNYSSRGANAAACVADTNPESYWDFMKAIFAQHASGEINNAALADMADSVGASDAKDCITSDGFRTYVKYADSLAREAEVSGTPTVYVNGAEADLNAFVDTVQAAIDANKAEASS